MTIRYKVEMIESERGWGQKVDEVLWFKSEDKAKKYVEDYNGKYNNESSTPDWYIVATGPYAREVPDEVDYRD
jgi:hypothetical protein